MSVSRDVGRKGRGFYLGHTLTGSRHPFASTSERGRTPTPRHDSERRALGSGKTTLAQKLQYEAFLQGARVVTATQGRSQVSPAGDVAPHVERVDLRPHASLRGMLDPLRIAPRHLAQDATVSFLRSLLPSRAEPAWETAIVAAVDNVITRSREPTCLEVVRALKDEGGVGGAVGETLEVYARSGLTQLGFSDPVCACLRSAPNRSRICRSVTSPAPQDTRRSEYTQASVRASRLCASSRCWQCTSCLRAGAPEGVLVRRGWRLLGTVGRALLGSLQRMGRSELAVPIISTQLVTDALVGDRAALESLVAPHSSSGCARRRRRQGLCSYSDSTRRTGVCVGHSSTCKPGVACFAIT